MSVENLEKKVLKWALDRGLMSTDNKMAQFLKTLEETTELGAAIQVNDSAEVKDAIGDIMVTLIIQSSKWGFTLEDCLASAYDEIQDRKGKW